MRPEETKERSARRLGALLVLLVMLGTLALGEPVLAAPGQAAPVRLSATLTCLPNGNAEVTFTVENLGRETLVIEPDFHLTLSAVRQGGPEPVAILFVFPAPGFKEIPPGESRTFIVPIDVQEPGDGGGDGGGGELTVRQLRPQGSTSLNARRLLLEAEVFLLGRGHPVRRVFSFPGCG